MCFPGAQSGRVYVYDSVDSSYTRLPDIRFPPMIMPHCAPTTDLVTKAPIMACQVPSLYEATPKTYFVALDLTTHSWVNYGKIIKMSGRWKTYN